MQKRLYVMPNKPTIPVGYRRTRFKRKLHLPWGGAGSRDEQVAIAVIAIMCLQEMERFKR